jgi:hypothetical protein
MLSAAHNVVTYQNGQRGPGALRRVVALIVREVVIYWSMPPVVETVMSFLMQCRAMSTLAHQTVSKNRGVIGRFVVRHVTAARRVANELFMNLVTVDRRVAIPLNLAIAMNTHVPRQLPLRAQLAIPLSRPLQPLRLHQHLKRACRQNIGKQTLAVPRARAVPTANTSDLPIPQAMDFASRALMPRTAVALPRASLTL